MKLLSKAILIPLALLAAGGYFAFNAARGPKVATALVTRGDIAQAVYATGAVEPLVWAKVLPLVRARIIEHCRCEGKRVNKGDVLARLDDRGAQADLNQAQAKRVFAAAEFSRQEDLFKRGVSTRQGLERARSDLQQVDSQINALKARLRDFLLVSPADGVVLRADGQIGDIPATTDVLFTVGEQSPLRVVAEVNEEDILRIKPGQKALLRNEGFGANGLESTVDAITPKGDPAAKTFRIYLRLPEDTPLRIGMNVEANIITGERRGVLLAPAEAIADAGGKAQVFALEGGKLRAIPVTLGMKGAKSFEVTGDIKEGQVLASPLKTEFRDGLAVRAK